VKSVGRDSSTTCCASLCCSDFEPKLDCLGKSHGSTESRPSVISSELKRAAPDTEPHCSPVLRPDVVTTRLREGFLLRLACGGQDGGQAGDSERRRGGAQRRPPPPLGLLKRLFRRDPPHPNSELPAD